MHNKYNISSTDIVQTGKRWTTEEEFLTLFAVRLSSLINLFHEIL